MRLVTKIGARCGSDASWLPALERQELIDAVHDNLTHLGVDALDVVNLRLHAMAQTDEPIGDEFTVLAELQQQGLIRHPRPQ